LEDGQGCAVAVFPVFLGLHKSSIFPDGNFSILFCKGIAMSDEQPKNPLHGMTLEMILTSLVEQFGWEELSRRIDIKSFKNDPSIKSSLKFLRTTPWAREKVEMLYLNSRKK
jgi:hypothetical protein